LINKIKIKWLKKNNSRRFQNSNNRTIENLRRMFCSKNIRKLARMKESSPTEPSSCTWRTRWRRMTTWRW